jgi:hypothetical protein
MRLPRAGGSLRVFSYPSLDSVVWTATDPAPPIDRVLAFDEDAGILAFVDAKGAPGRIDFRLDNVALATRARLNDLASVDGSTIYGLTKDGALLRLTPSGDWTFKPPRAARAALPLSDGSVVLLSGRERNAVVWRLRPPSTKVLDTAEVPGASRAAWVQAGDRLYFTVDHSLTGVRTRDLQPLNEIELDHQARKLVATPSGDRLFVLSDSSRKIGVIDRYRERVSEEIELPGQPEDLRIDPLGRYLLVRAAKADSVWIIAIGTDRLVGTVPSTWRSDLPFVAPDGSVAIAHGRDVAFVDGQTLREKRRVDQGATDFWYGFAWSGFRPRAASLDQPVRFPGADTTDTTGHPVTDSTRQQVAVQPGRDTATPPPPTGRGWIVSFAALLNEEKARELAATIHVHNETARVLATPREGQVIYRVVLGPYPTRDEAERAGRDSKQNYWVYEATP